MPGKNGLMRLSKSPIPSYIGTDSRLTAPTTDRLHDSHTLSQSMIVPDILILELLDGTDRGLSGFKCHISSLVPIWHCV